MNVLYAVRRVLSRSSEVSISFHNNVSLYLDRVYSDAADMNAQESSYNSNTEEFSKINIPGIRGGKKEEKKAKVVELKGNQNYGWLHGRLPKGWWESLANQHIYMSWLQKKLGFTKAEDWHQVKAKDFVKYRGSGLLGHYGGSPEAVINFLVGSPLKKVSIPTLLSRTKAKRYWDSVENQRKYLDAVGTKIGVRGNDLSPWYNQIRSGLLDLGFGRVLRRYNGSISAMLATVYPEYEWQLWRFSHMPKYSTQNPETVAVALKYLEDRLGIKSPEDWYNVTLPQIIEHNVRFLIRERTLCEVLKEAYPNYGWLPWKFPRTPRKTVDSPETIESALSYLEKKLRINSSEDWYRVSSLQLREHGLLFLTSKRSLFETLRRYRPSFQWDESKFVGVRIFGKKLLGAYLRQIFPSEEILEDYSFSESNSVNVSYFIPSLKLAFDYQTDVDYGVATADGVVSLALAEDKAKASLAKKDNVSLVFIPFWWDRSLDSLMATIANASADMKERLLRDGYEVDLTQSIPRETKLKLSSWRRRYASEHQRKATRMDEDGEAN